MMLSILFISIIGIIFTIIAIAHDEFLVKVLLGLFGLFFLGLAMYTLGLDNGHKESLRGNNPYRMEIRYEFKDSIYITKDTIFTKIEK